MDSIPVSTTNVGLFSANDVTPETVMSELNLFRPSTTLPEWDATGTHGPVYIQVSSHTAELSAHKGLPKSYSEVASAAEGSMQDDSTGLTLPMTPPTSDSGPCSSGSAHSEDRNSNSDCEAEQPPRKKRTPIPDERKDAKYWERRKKNNEAAKRSREMRRQKMDDELKTARESIQENQKLKQEIEVLKSEINSLRRLLRDANMTLSLWIRAKQASEPPSQLPPMLRSPNVSFVNFPVTTGI